MDLIFKLFGLGVILVVLDIILSKADRKDIAFWIGLSGVVVAMVWVVPKIKNLLDTVTSLFNIY